MPKAKKPKTTQIKTTEEAKQQIRSFGRSLLEDSRKVLADYREYAKKVQKDLKAFSRRSEELQDRGIEFVKEMNSDWEKAEDDAFNAAVSVYGKDEASDMSAEGAFDLHREDRKRFEAVLDGLDDMPALTEADLESTISGLSEVDAELAGFCQRLSSMEV